MKTEYYLAEFHLEDLKKYKKPDGRWHIINRTCHEHKFACQRFLDKAKTDLDWAKAFQTSLSQIKEFPDFLMASIEAFIEDKKEEQTDLKNAIKIYEKNGI